MDRIRWGILGLGAIAGEFADALTRAGCTLEACASRSHEKAESFKSSFGAKHAFGSYEELIHCADVDAVYIATPHNLHHKWALECLKNNKHVLCEKAICVNCAQLNELCAEAQKRNLIFREAMTVYHMPVMEKLKSMTGADAPLGKLKTLDISFGSFKEYSPDNRFFNPELAGGALLDIGVYALSLARFFLSSQPDTVLTAGVNAPTGVDEQSGIVLKNSEGELAVITLALRAKLPKRAVISCENGYACIDNYPRADSAEIVWTHDGSKTTLNCGNTSDALAYEAKTFESLILKNEDNNHLALTKDVMELMDKIRIQWNI